MLGMLNSLTTRWFVSGRMHTRDFKFIMVTTQDKHNLCCQRVARLEVQTSTGYDWERAVKVSTCQFTNIY